MTKDVKRAKEPTAPEVTEDKLDFAGKLMTGKIKLGSRIGFTPQGSDIEKVIIADQAFFDLKVMPVEFYRQYKYNVK